MNYIYDIVLNFQDEYYEFYEWKLTDKIINIKRILVYKISNKDYLNLKYNKIIIDRKCLPKQNKIFLVTNGIEVMGILLDNDGKITKRSSLLIDEADEIIEEKEKIKSLAIEYKENIRKSKTSKGRLLEEKIQYIEQYFNNINISEDEYLLKYIYYDIFNIEENNINIIYNQLKELIDKDINKIYNTIKKVNIELK